MSVLDFEIRSTGTPNHPLGRFRYLVQFRPTREDLAALGGRGVHTNWFFVDGSRKDRLEEAIADYWERKLAAADAGRPYAQHHKTTLLLEVQSGDDDAGQRNSGSNFDSDNILITIQGAVILTSGGFRFQNVTIPQASTINSCVFKPYVDAHDDPACELYFNDVDDAANFVTEADVASRARTTASVTWNTANIGLGRRSSPDLTAPCQEVISRPGWGSGNALCVLVIGGGGLQTLDIVAYEHTVYPPAQLDIDYEGPAAAAPIEVLAYMADR